jgi:hypothetical protein
MFGFDKYLGDTRQKLAILYNDKPELFKKEKTLILGYYEEFEGLSKILDDKWRVFEAWFMRVPSPETITRNLRALKEDGTIQLSEAQQQDRIDKEQQYRSFWGNEAKTRQQNGGNSKSDEY